MLSITGNCLNQSHGPTPQQTQDQSTVCSFQLLPAYLQVWQHTLHIRIDEKVRETTDICAEIERLCLRAAAATIYRICDVTSCDTAGCPNSRRDSQAAFPARHRQWPSCHH